MLRLVVVAALVAAVVVAQQPGHQKDNTHPAMTTYTCTKADGCTARQNKIVLDSNWMWTHKKGTYTNCFTGNTWDSGLCPDPVTCAQNCALDGGDYESTYGVSVSGDTVRLNFVTKGQYASNVGSRLYLLQDDSNYEMFKLLNREFAFDTDVSNLPCGLNGALYTVEMDQDGGMSKYSGNNAGAAYGTGYCDAQCPHDLKFINGMANIKSWQPSSSDPNSGVGYYGTCCSEMDLWESNSISQAYTAHTCTVRGQTMCNTTYCGDDDKNQRYQGWCDKDGADFNPYRNGDKTFYGPGSNFAVDSTKKITVVTQFVTDDGTDTGTLSEIRRFYVQNGIAIPVRNVTVGGKTFDSLSDAYAIAEKKAFGDTPSFEPRGGMKNMGQSLGRGHVLVMSLWADFAAHMLWLDSDYPTDKPASTPGVGRGSCSTSSGNPPDVEKQSPNAYVTYGNIRFGEIGSTTSGSTPTPTPTPNPSGCPGGSLEACIKLCPSSPPSAFKACVDACSARCSR